MNKRVQSSIIYVLVSRGKDTVLSDYSPHAGNFPTVTKDVLKRVNQTKPFGNFTTQKYNFHIYSYQGFIFLAMVESEYQMRIIVEFLKDIQKCFFSQFPERIRNTAIAYGLNNQFKKVLQRKMADYNCKQKIDKISALKKQIKQLSDTSMQNLDKVLDRGQSLDILVKKTNVMVDTSIDYKDTATKVKRTMWWKNKKIIVAIVFVIILVIFIIVLIACGGFTFKKCK